MSNLLEHAKLELKMAGLFYEAKDFYGGYTGRAVMELIEVFDKQGHSGMSAPMVISIFSKLADFKPLQPITCRNEEWVLVDDKNETYQNKRCSAIFKEGINGRPYYLNAIVWKEKGGAFTGTVEEISSRQFIKLPFTPKTFYVLVDENRNIIDKEALKEAFEYYEK